MRFVSIVVGSESNHNSDVAYNRGPQNRRLTKRDPRSSRFTKKESAKQQVCKKEFRGPKSLGTSN